MTYDFIICGAGAAGLSFVHHLLKSPLRNSTVLLIDKDSKQSNDRTWCYWSTQDDDYSSLHANSWGKIRFQSFDYERTDRIDPYRYQCLRGLDFYQFVFEEIAQAPNIHFQQQAVIFTSQDEKGVEVRCEQSVYKGKILIDSVSLPDMNTLNELILYQNFLGWTLETPEASFDPSVMTLMDFRCKVQTPASFFYVLPFSTNQALIEFTRFDSSATIGPAYETHLKEYISQTLGIKDFMLTATETGRIPMTNHRFQDRVGQRIYRIGTAGGDTKPTTGYTFQNIQKHCLQVINELTGKSVEVTDRGRFRFYDQLLLDIMYKNPEKISDIMTRLFKQKDFAQILKFLDEETELTEDLLLLGWLPWPPFIQAIRHQKFL